MAELTPKQRQYLKGLAHGLAPVVRVGRGGVNEGVAVETRRSLDAHELIKIRIDAEDSSDRRAIAQELAESCDAMIAGSIGKIVILYRPKDEDPVIKLP